MILFICSCGKHKGRNNNEYIPKIAALSPSTEIIKSQLTREKGQLPLTYQQVQKTLKEGKELSGNYLIPREGKAMEEQTVFTSAELGNCGLNFNSLIGERVKDCAQTNLEKAKWIAQENSFFGEGDWELVLNRDGHSVWRDITTGLLWSSTLPDEYQKNWISTTGADGNIELRACQYKPSGPLNDFPKTQVEWRIPTRADYLQADINGARNVLNGQDDVLWTGTQVNEQYAWAINQGTGILKKSLLTEEHKVKCVGIVINE